MWQRIKKSILSKMQYAERSPIVYNIREYSQNERIRNLVRAIVAPFEYIKTVSRKNVSVEGRKGLAFVLIAKNEAPYIEEMSLCLCATKVTGTEASTFTILLTTS
ncbi:MAG: hypothetical protein IJQ74_02535 [Synergistaceae bacterium]|nr:hypothetical protein [Synergistaceae bacterium]